jgi:hypothetical protein
MVERASADHPELAFKQGAIEELDGDGTYDAVLLTNTLEYTYDIGSVLRIVHGALRGNGKCLITTANPLWSPVFKLASVLGFRIPECERLFVTNEDVVNMLRLHGFEIADKRMALIIPKYIPLVSEWVNWLAPRLPIVRLLCSTQLIMARKVPSARRDYSVSVIIPCHNEVENVGRCVSEMRKFGTRTEVVFVDDGSTDGTGQSIRAGRQRDIDIKVVGYPSNRGKGYAVSRGFAAATGDILVVLDADLTTHPDELGPLYEAFAAGRAEFVNCTRLVYPLEGHAMRFANYVGNKVFNILVSLVMGRRVSDTLCGTKALFRWDYQYMTMGRDPWGDYDLLFGARQLCLAVRELPVHYRVRELGQSKMNSLSHGVNLLRMCWRGFWQVQTLRGYTQPDPASSCDRERTDGEAMKTGSANGGDAVDELRGSYSSRGRST